ncbi:MAG: NAD(P)-binding domain-containing protein [Chloroflexota bacterium]
MIRTTDTVIIGAGQAGLVMSRLLSEASREHVVLERRPTLGGGWQDRWDAFRLVSPNWTVSVPGHPYAGPEPDGFMPRDDLVRHFRDYATVIDAPVELETDVTGVDGIDAGGMRFEVATNRGPVRARTVVVAAGPFQIAHIPSIAAGLSPDILSLHVDQYRNAAALPPGGVLLVGSGQSGVQLAEELAAAGRAVTLSVGRCGRAPRRYRGKDIFWWLRELGTRGARVGTPLPTADQLASPAARFACNPQLSGHGGGHEINLRRMAADGIRLVGRLEALDGTLARMRPDLNDNLRFADTFFEERLRTGCDLYAERMGLNLPIDEMEEFVYDVPEIEELDLATEGISTVLWTSGYRPSLGWIHLPVLDDYGLPRQAGGRSEVPGLAFIGTPWLLDMGSANLVGLVRDAETLAPLL